MYPMAGYEQEKGRILIVDDDLQMQDMLKAMLSLYGYLPEVAGDGFEAGVKVMAFKPGLIVLDLFLPGMDGFEVCRRIKENDATSHMKVFAVTGHDSRENRDRIMAMGADGYISKPFDTRTFLQNVSELLKREVPVNSASKETRTLNEG
jgi:DNA-binding response OmpR family regulator